jgi:murein DD-endopeptidase MepM/ murein hydrolase activator NlpD
METPFLYFPVKQPIDQQNLFGANPAEYKPLGQDGHPGNDFECPVGTPVYAPCDGDAFYTTDKDGGCGLWIRVPNNASPQFNVILWHMPPKGTPEYPYQVATDGSTTPVKAGQLLGYSGNSGYPLESTGPHLHLGVLPCDTTGGALAPNNGFEGCVDPQPYFNGHYAQDIQAIEAVVASATTVVQSIAATPDATPAQKLTWIQEIAKAVESLF